MLVTCVRANDVTSAEAGSEISTHTASVQWSRASPDPDGNGCGEMDEFWAKVEGSHGLLTTQQGLMKFGKRGFYRRADAGQFVAVHRGVWRVAGSPITDRQTLLGLALAHNAVASFRSTLALAGVPGYTLTKFELTRATQGTVAREIDERKVTFHRSNYLPVHHITAVDSIPSTTLARALCDSSAVMSTERLSRVVDSCKRLGLVTYDDLAKCREDIRARGRRRTTVLDEILEARISGWIVGESPPEDKVRRWLEDAGYSPVTQHWVVAQGKRRRLDLALVDDRVAVEYQGTADHATATSVISDSEKITDLQLAGWFVVLVTKKTTRYELIRNVEEAIRRQHASP